MAVATVCLLLAVCIAPAYAASGAAQFPAPSGWDSRGKFVREDVFRFCAVTTDTKVTGYWQITYGGAYEPTYAVVRSQAELDGVWAKLRYAPEKPAADFAADLLVVIQPGKSITQYKYRVTIREDAAAIRFTVDEYFAGPYDAGLVGQEAILAFRLPQTDKKIAVTINKAPGSGGPYPK
jgi:hypothetical protein